MAPYILPFIGLCIGALACHDPLMNWIDARLSRPPTTRTKPLIQLTKPFEVGKTYKRVDGTFVICTQVNDRKGYETAQFSDFVECHQRVMADLSESGVAFLARLDPDYANPTKSGYRYNRAEDRGRCTGSSWNGYAVIPEPRTDQHVLDLVAHLRLSFRKA